MSIIPCVSHRSWIAIALTALTVACESSRPPPSTAPSATSTQPAPPPSRPNVPPAPSDAAAASATPPPTTDDIPRTAAATNSNYPVVDTCKPAQAIVKEKRTLPPRASWEPITSVKQRISFSVPPSVFKVTDDANGLVLTSSLSAPGLGPGAKPHVFSIRVRRVDTSIDDLLADTSKTSPLGQAYVEGAFPKRRERSFAPYADTSRGPGFAMDLTLAHRPAYVFVNGAEGYNTDVSLLRAGPRDTVLVFADWNSSIMVGQPECWQQQIIAGVLDTFSIR